MRKFLILTLAASFCFFVGLCDPVSAKGNRDGAGGGNVSAKWNVTQGAVAKSKTKLFRSTHDKLESKGENVAR